MERCKAARCQIEEKIAEVPYIAKLLDIKGVGMKTIVGFVAEIGDIRRFTDLKQIQKLADMRLYQMSRASIKERATLVIGEGRDSDMLCMRLQLV